MKKLLIPVLCTLMLAACAKVEPTLSPAVALPTENKAFQATVTPPPTQDLTADWTAYVNTELGYSFKYPSECFSGPLAAECKQNPPEERAPECLCFLNAEDPHAVGLQSFLGNPEEGLTLVTFMVSQHETPAFNPPVADDWVPWLQETWPLSEEMPDEPNSTLGGLPAVRIYIPGSPQAYAAEKIFVLKQGKLILIDMVDVDVAAHQEFYGKILETIQFDS